MLLIETDLARFTEADLRRMLDALPPTWQARVLRKKPLKSRLQSAIAYTLLRRILQDEYGITDLPAITTNEYGKPYFEECDLYFSISHCNAAVACIVEPHPVGIDVQDILHDPDSRLKSRLGLPPDTDDRELTKHWTQLEASAKLDGRGLGIGIESLPIEGHKLETIEYSAFFLSTAI